MHYFNEFTKKVDEIRGETNLEGYVDAAHLGKNCAPLVLCPLRNIFLVARLDKRVRASQAKVGWVGILLEEADDPIYL